MTSNDFIPFNALKSSTPQHGNAWHLNEFAFRFVSEDRHLFLATFAEVTTAEITNRRFFNDLDGDHGDGIGFLGKTHR